MSFRFLLINATLLALACPIQVTAEPLFDQDIGPLAGTYNLVDSTEGADLLAKGGVAWSVSSITASHAASGRQDEESLVFDGETTRVEFRLRFAPTDRLEVGLELPYVWQSSGRLDSLIDTWHDVFDLPGGNRRVRERDLLEYRYENANGVALDFTSSTSGMGDVRFLAGWRLGGSENHERALRFAVTVPTGDADELLGSDAVTVGAGLAGDLSNLGAGDKWSAYYRLHATWLTEPALLPTVYEDWIAHAAGGFGWAATDWMDLRAQVLARTATHDSDLRQIGDPAVILSFGANLRLGDSYSLSLSVGEDLWVESSPDVSFQLSLRYRPGD